MEHPPAPPDLPEDAHKGDAGRVLAFVGSRTMPGAAILVGRAAQRAGAGLVTLAVPDLGTVRAIAPAAPEATYVLLEEDLPGATREARAPWTHVRADVRVVGCGRGDDARTRALIAALVAEPFAGPLVVDADALNAVAGAPERLARATGALVLTPHPGEAARLLGRRVGAEAHEREAAAAELARRTGGIAVLKGAHTVVSDGRRTWVASTGNPGMATAGAGDVLAGILGAYLCDAVRAPGFTVWDAVRAAVHVHGLAGDLAASALGRRGLIASDLVEHLPAAEASHRRGRTVG